ncbi:hypothetical protein [Dactylosporangium sp. NPDC005555]|uniref:hypothetical protein n=1 Tax=Dactylosporangium sp. NPDC005555 TaxID=3154889 RepID=UPI0033B7C8DE
MVVQVPPGGDDVDERSRATDAVLSHREAAFDQDHRLATARARTLCVPAGHGTSLLPVSRMITNPPGWAPGGICRRT